VSTSKIGSSPEPLYDDAFYKEWATQALAHLQQLCTERHPASRSGRKIRRVLERLGR
jgi:hypothetical protein